MELYICSTYYHALITILKGFYYSKKRPCNEKICVYLLDTIENSDALMMRMNSLNLFKWVICLNTPNFVKEKSLMDKLFWKKIGTNKLDKYFSVSFETFRNIYLYMDDTWIADYFKCKNIKYHLIEDSINGYKYILNTRYARLADPSLNGWLNIIYKFFPNAEGNYSFLLNSNSVIDIEVNDSIGTIFGNDKRVLEFPRDILFSLMNDATISEKVIKVFMPNPHILDGDNLVIIFTSPFCDDKLVNSIEEQINIYNKLAKNYTNHTLLIKAHPRDKADYGLIKNAIILPRNFPSELIRFLDDSKIYRYVSIASHCVDIYPSEKVDFYELEEVKTWT